MARGKKGRKSAVTNQAKQPETPKQKQTVTVKRGRYSVVDYIIVTVFFIAFCYLQKFIALKILGGPDLDPSSLQFISNSLDFFFDTIWKGFVVIAFLVWLHDLFTYDVGEEDTA